MPDRKTGRMIAAVIVLVGAILLIVALVVPWYSYETSAPGASATVNFYTGFPTSNGTIQYSCSGTVSCPSQTSYSHENLNDTGMIAEAGFFLLIGGVLLGIIAAVLGVASRGNPRRASPAIALAVVALILAIAAPGLFALALPGAVGKDSPGHPANGPWSSFFGSNSSTGSGGSVTTTWGPAVGWYLSIVAFVLLLVGVILLARSRKEPRPAAAPWDSASVVSPMPPPYSPPAP